MTDSFVSIVIRAGIAGAAPDAASARVTAARIKPSTVRHFMYFACTLGWKMYPSLCLHVFVHLGWKSVCF
jgi:hypothetical protein